MKIKYKIIQLFFELSLLPLFYQERNWRSSPIDRRQPFSSTCSVLLRRLFAESASTENFFPSHRHPRLSWHPISLLSFSPSSVLLWHRVVLHSPLVSGNRFLWFYWPCASPRRPFDTWLLLSSPIVRSHRLDVSSPIWSRSGYHRLSTNRRWWLERFQWQRWCLSETIKLANLANPLLVPERNRRAWVSRDVVWVEFQVCRCKMMRGLL